MEIERQLIGAVTVLRPVGPLIDQDAEAFGRAVDEAMADSMGRFVIDGAAVPFADSKGIEALLDAAEAVSDTGRLLRLCGITDTLREVLELTGVSSLIDFYEDASDAARSFL